MNNVRVIITLLDNQNVDEILIWFTDRWPQTQADFLTECTCPVCGNLKGKPPQSEFACYNQHSYGCAVILFLPNVTSHNVEEMGQEVETSGLKFLSVFIFKCGEDEDYYILHGNVLKKNVVVGEKNV